MTSPDEFQARVEWVTALLELRVLASEGAPPDSPQVIELMERAAAAHATAKATGAKDRALRERFGLTRSECDVLWYLVAHAVAPRARQLLVNATGELVTSVDALRRCIHGEEVSLPSLIELSADCVLRRTGLVDEHNGNEPSRRVWTIPDRVLAWLKGDRTLGHDVAALAMLPAPQTTRLVGDSGSIERLRVAVRSPDSLVAVAGTAGSGRRTMIRVAASDADIPLVEVNAAQLARDHDRFAGEMRLLARECKLLGRVLLVLDIENLGDDRLELFKTHLLANVHGPVFVTCRSAKRLPRSRHPIVVIDVKPLTSEQRAALWHDALGQGTQDDADYLASQYPLAPALIHHAAKGAKASANGGPLQPEDIYAGIRAVLDDRLGDFAKRVEVTQTWDDVVLPDDHFDAIQYLIARIRRRRTVYEQWGFAAKVGKGLGTSALFSGPPGTGKTMVAALIAKELGIELYQVDMAQIVSKYIGETERNMSALFDAAEASHAILLFDEADSLFGKRTDVKSSNDRYANLETNYLLQRLESFTGICLLTSNHESSIDPAFQRRLSLHLRFELPDVEERAALWKAMLPKAAPVEPHLDTMELARRFAMSGGYIRNASLRAAFQAADEGSLITKAHLERAARLEYEGMGKIAA